MNKRTLYRLEVINKTKKRFLNPVFWIITMGNFIDFEILKNIAIRKILQISWKSLL
jgi:hypothetical protein